jgi:hypothetical protein
MQVALNQISSLNEKNKELEGKVRKLEERLE